MSAEAPLRGFVLRVLVWLPIAFALWFFTAEQHLAPVVWASEAILRGWFPEAVAELRLRGDELLLVTHFGEVGGRVVPNAPPGENLGFLANPLIYSYSLPLYAALTLATAEPRVLGRLVWGLVLLGLVEVASVVGSTLKTLAFEVGSVFLEQQQWGEAARNGAAMAYQFGSLLLPMVAPVVLWLALNRGFLERIAPDFARGAPGKKDASPR